MSEDQPRDGEMNLSWDGGGGRSQQGEIRLNELYHLLASSRRRTLLKYLITRPNQPVPMEDLVAIVVESECPEREPATHRVRVSTDLHHVHLPKLADAGILSYDTAAEAVKYHRSEEIETLLAASNEIDGGNEYSPS